LDDALRVEPQFGLMRQQRHDDGFEELDRALVQVGAERLLHGGGLAVLAQQVVEGQETAQPAAVRAFRSTGSGHTTWLEERGINLFHVKINLFPRC